MRGWSSIFLQEMFPRQTQERLTQMDINTSTRKCKHSVLGLLLLWGNHFQMGWKERGVLASSPLPPDCSEALEWLPVSGTKASAASKLELESHLRAGTDQLRYLLKCYTMLWLEDETSHSYQTTHTAKIVSESWAWNETSSHFQARNLILPWGLSSACLVSW